MELVHPHREAISPRQAFALVEAIVANDVDISEALPREPRRVITSQTIGAKPLFSHRNMERNLIVDVPCNVARSKE
jgi:hypothetical protein